MLKLTFYLEEKKYICLTKKNLYFCILKRRVHQPSNLGPMGPFLPAIIPNKGAAAGALVALNKNSPTGGHLPPSSKHEGMNTPSPSSYTSSSSGKNLPPLKGEFSSIAEKVQSNHCTPKKTVQLGPFSPTPTSEEDKILEQAKKKGIVKFEDGYENQDGQKVNYKEAGESSLTKKGIAIYTDKVHEPNLVEKNSPLAKDFVDAAEAEEKKYDKSNEILVKEEDKEVMPLAGMLKPDPGNLLLLPSQTHLVVVSDEKNNCYLAIGTLTSAKSNNVYLSPSQIYNAKKSQYLDPFTYPRIVPKEHFQVHREATAFIQKKYIAETIQNEYKDFILECSHLEIYNPKMLTADVLEKMIQHTVDEKISDSSQIENNNTHDE